ncbi:MAG TPA: hypothetical protein VMU17_01450 [Elusimicrobiota bacterium]|nr:hypothetical protein [Elusimicrobiota bacterium]
MLDDVLYHMSCKQFARQVAAGVLPMRGMTGRFHFWMHWAICPFCRRYWREIHEIGALQQAQCALANHPAVKISDVKKRLKIAVEKAFP